MNQAWIDNTISNYYKRVSIAKIEIVKELQNQVLIAPAYREKLLMILRKPRWEYGDMYQFELLSHFGFYKEDFGDELGDQAKRTQDELTIFSKWSHQIRDYADLIYDAQTHDPKSRITHRYLDSEPKYFEGDIIITDPCYITKSFDRSTEPKWEDYHSLPSIKDYPDYDARTNSSVTFTREAEEYNKAIQDWDEKHPRDWHRCDCGSNMEVLGIYNYMVRDTIYGDWSCHTFDADTDEPIGQFCADTGLVGVFQLDEVLKYNPDFNYHIERDWTTTWIKDFKGTVQFVVEEKSGVYDYDTEYHKKGDTWTEYEVSVVGDGINMKTGKLIRFKTRQTGL